MKSTIPEISRTKAPPPTSASRAQREMDLALRFTRAYQSYADDQIAEREAACLALQYPALLGDIRQRDLFAGRERKLSEYIVRFSPQQSGDGGGQAGYCLNTHYLQQMAEEAGPEYAEAALRLREFWQEHCTYNRVVSQRDDTLRAFLGHGLGGEPGSGALMGGGTLRLGGMVLDFDTLLQLGIPGLRHRIQHAAANAAGEAPKARFYEALRQSLEVVVAALQHYRNQTMALAAMEPDPSRVHELQQMASILDSLCQRAPQSLREAIQLAWLYSVLACTRSYGRIDVWLGDFYARDIDAGTLSEEEAQRLLASLWSLIDGESDHPWDTRTVVGGQGRRNEANADRFALAAMEATRRYRRIVPCLTLRFYRGQDPALMRKALDVIGEGCLYPMLYNDDVLVAAVQREMQVPREDALGYFPLGCGEFILDHVSICSPNTGFNVGKCVEAALHNGRCATSKALIGADAGPLEAFDSFEKLYDAVKQQVRTVAPLFARIHAIEACVQRQRNTYLLISMLTDDCIARGTAVVDGGARYLGACVEGFGFTNAGDSLAAIRQVVYEQEAITLKRLVAALDADFVGYEKERALLLAVPKFGNDDATTDRMVVDFASFVCDEIMIAGQKAGLDFLIISNVNPGGHGMGYQCGASADGRPCGEPFAIGNSPTAGRDVCGMTSLFNSIARTNPENGGAITNFKITSDFFAHERPKLEAMLNTYWARGGFQANITVVRREDLEKALEEPEKYPHLLVRVGGWSSRFIDLERRWQLEIVRRTLY